MEIKEFRHEQIGGQLLVTARVNTIKKILLNLNFDSIRMERCITYHIDKRSQEFIREMGVKFELAENTTL